MCVLRGWSKLDFTERTLVSTVCLSSESPKIYLLTLNMLSGPSGSWSFFRLRWSFFQFSLDNESDRRTWRACCAVSADFAHLYVPSTDTYKVDLELVSSHLDSCTASVSQLQLARELLEEQLPQNWLLTFVTKINFAASPVTVASSFSRTRQRVRYYFHTAALHTCTCVQWTFRVRTMYPDTSVHLRGYFATIAILDSSSCWQNEPFFNLSGCRALEIFGELFKHSAGHAHHLNSWVRPYEREFAPRSNFVISSNSAHHFSCVVRNTLAVQQNWRPPFACTKFNSYQTLCRSGKHRQHWEWYLRQKCK